MADERKRPHLPIGYWLKKADELLTERINAAQAANGLSRTEWQILNLLHESGSAPRADITETLRPFASADSLEAAIMGLIERGLLAEDGSGGSALRLTDQGRVVHGEALATQKAVRQRAVQGISEADYATTVRVLQQLVANLTDEGA